MWLKKEFAERLVQMQPKFRRVSLVPFKLNARCVVCGDSQSSEFKARFWVFEKNDELYVKCFNCEYSARLTTYLKEQDEDLYREYILERRKMQGKEAPKPKIEEPVFKAKLVIERLDYCERLDRLPKEHPIIKYVLDRKIPVSAWKRLWFTVQWPALCNSIKPDTYKQELNEPRLVIPIYNAEGKMESFQGRALRANAPQKYITIKAHDDATKIYGLDTVNESKDVLIFEGPIDSLFIDNGIAITGGSMDLGVVPFAGNRIWVLDNEPRHEDTIKRMEKLIDSGERVCFWDKAPWTSKDINDMVKNEAAEPQDIKEYILANSLSGLFAKHRMIQFRKI